MKSTIRVKQDWQENEPYIQLKLDTANPNEDVDLADSALIHFVNRASSVGLKLVYPSKNEDIRSPQIRIMYSHEFEWKVLKEFRQMCKESLSEEDLKLADQLISGLYKQRKSLLVDQTPAQSS